MPNYCRKKKTLKLHHHFLAHTVHMTQGTQFFNPSNTFIISSPYFTVTNWQWGDIQWHKYI